MQFDVICAMACIMWNNAPLLTQVVIGDSLYYLSAVLITYLKSGHQWTGQFNGLWFEWPTCLSVQIYSAITVIIISHWSKYLASSTISEQCCLQYLSDHQLTGQFNGLQSEWPILVFLCNLHCHNHQPLEQIEHTGNICCTLTAYKCECDHQLTGQFNR